MHQFVEYFGDFVVFDAAKTATTLLDQLRVFGARAARYSDPNANSKIKLRKSRKIFYKYY
jgi:hypothetical protein